MNLFLDTCALVKLFHEQGRVELIVLPAVESVVKGFSHEPSTQIHGDNIDFTAATYLAAVEDDESEDAIWESYLK